MKFLFFIFYFITIFNLKIAIPPYSLLFLTGVSGLVLFFYLLCLSNFKINKLEKNFLFIIFVYIFIIFLSMLYNQVLDFYYLKEIVLFGLISYFSAYVSVYIVRDRILDDLFLIKSFVFLVDFQLLISFICYLNPSLFDLVFSFFSRPDIDSRILDFNETRLVGLGASFFGSGIINCFTLILISAVLRNNIKNRDALFFIFSFILVFSIGLMSSRSTIIGALISIILIFSKFTSIKKLLKLLIVILPLTLMILIFLPKNDRITDIFSFGFDFLFNFKDSQASKSTGELQEMWGMFPSTFKTWLIGDVYYRTPDGGYYMNTDVGYYRVLYATGFLGLFIFMFLNVYMIYKIKNIYFKFFEKICLIALFLILNTKGLTSFLPFLSIFYLANYFKIK